MVAAAKILRRVGDPAGRLGHPVQLDAEVLAVGGEHLGVRAERRLGPVGPDRPDQRPAGHGHLAAAVCSEATGPARKCEDGQVCCHQQVGA
jgi:hypothetical protein